MYSYGWLKALKVHCFVHYLDKNRHFTDLIKCINLHGKAIDTRHCTHSLKIWTVGCKVGLKWNVVEVAITYVWLFPILQDRLS